MDAGGKVDFDSGDDRWNKALKRDILDASVDFGCSIFEREISLRDVVDLEPGDIIPVEMAEHVILKANGIPLFKTRLATSNGNLALKVEDVYQQAE